MSELTLKQIEDYAKANDENYGRCEACKYLGNTILCGECEEGSGYEFDAKEYERNHGDEIEAKLNGWKKFNVSMAVDGRVDVEVFAADFNSAFEKAKIAFMFANLQNMEVVGSKPVNAECEDGEFVDYNG